MAPIITKIDPTKSIVVVITPPSTEYLIYPYVYLLSGLFLLFFSKKYDIPIDNASPKSCIESDMIATLPVIIPPNISNIENEILRRKAINIFFFFFIFTSFYYLFILYSSNVKLLFIIA